MNIFLYLSFYIFILFSIIGYGNIFQKIFFKKEEINLGYTGFFIEAEKQKSSVPKFSSGRLNKRAEDFKQVDMTCPDDY